MKRNLLSSVFFILSFSLFAQIPTWHTTGIGGGGALFCPSVNPANTSEYYVGCDMSEEFHSTDFGGSYSIIDFTQLQGFHDSKVCFTSTPGLLYCVNYANNQSVPVKSTDNGATWTTLAGNPDATETTYSIWADYNNPNRVIISYYGAIYFSGDGGNSFTSIHIAVNSGSGNVVGGVFFDSNNIYIGTNDGLLESTNGGTSFSVFSTTGIASGEAINSFAAAKQNGTLRFFCLTGSSGNIYAGQQGSDYYGFLKNVYSMDNNSGTWVQRMSGITATTDYLMFVAMAENDVSTAYLGGSNSSGVPNVMKTIDGGMTWTHVFNTTNNANITTGWCGAGGDHAYSWPECIFGMTVASTNKNVVLFTDFSDVMKTSDGGTTWHQGYVASADEHPAGASTPTRQYYHSIGLENTACWFIHWMDASNMFSAYTDIFGIRSQNGGSSWAFDYTSSAPSHNTIYCIVKNISNSTLYAGTSSRHDMYKSYVLTDANIDAQTGEVITSADNGATWTVLHNFSHPVYWLATDPNNNERMYAAVVNYAQGVGGIWVTNNLSMGASSTWTHLATAPRTEGHPATMTVLNNGKLLCSFSGRRTTVFTNSSGVFLYDPGTSTWTDKSDANQHYYCHDVIVDPNDATQNTWYSGVYSGWGGTGNGMGGLYKTTNGGTSWSKIFSNGDVSSCTFDPNNPNTLYVATMGNGLWYSTNINNATPGFSQISNYLFSAPERIFFNPNDHTKLWVASFGHGMQWADLSSTSIAQINNNEQIIVFPNPASETVTINIPGNASISDLKLFNVVGQEIEIHDYLLDKNHAVLNVNMLSGGFYFVQVRSSSGAYTARFVKDY